MTDEQFAEHLFNAHNSQGPNPWKTWDGKVVPVWAELNDQVRAKWLAVARAAQSSAIKEFVAATKRG